MSELLLFHHAQGLTGGFVGFADRLRAGGVTVHTPDLYAGRTFDSLDEGVAHAQELGMDAVIQAGVAAAEGLPAALVTAGWSLGAMPAQKLAQTRPGVRGCLLFAAAAAPGEFGDWPAGLPVQVHAKASDPWFANEWDQPAAEALVAAADDGELFLYPGDQHLFIDSDSVDFDPAATDLLVQRVAEFLARI